ncbi:MAG TPA: lysozyme inhibitor LprI family protein [Candidatus Angelobacter sp.]
MRSSTFLPAFFLLTGFCAALAQSTIVDPGAKQMCAAVKDVELPVADRPTPAEERALASCASVDAYFGFGQPADPVKARKCAYAEIDRGSKATMSGKVILIMVYANGNGATRSFDAAMKLACSLGGAPGDDAGRVYQLDRLRKQNWTGNNFRVCDHSSGREMYEQCAILTERFDKIERDQKFNDLISAWKAPEKKAFHAFMAEVDRYVQIQANNGVNLEGTFEIQEEIFIRRNLLSALESFESGELPKYSAEEFQRAEAAESAAYQRTQVGDQTQWGTVTRAGVRKSQEEWLRYRDAWIAFGKSKYPGVTEQSWKAWLDIDRTVTLNRFLH